MATFYSAAAGGFFDNSIHAEIPEGSIEISPHYHAELMAGLGQGKRIGADGDGLPYLVTLAVPDAAQLLAAERAQMVMTRLQFALQALADGVMTAAETEAFLGPRAVPQIGEEALLLIEDAGFRVVARMRLVGFERLERNDPFLVPLQVAVRWTDAQVDDFFRAGMLL